MFSPPELPGSGALLFDLFSAGFTLPWDESVSGEAFVFEFVFEFEFEFVESESVTDDCSAFGVFGASGAVSRA